MPRTMLSGMIPGILLFCGGEVLLASEVDELRERAKALREKASISAEQGKPDQAERLERESGELMEAAERLELKARERGGKGDRPGFEKEVQRLKERLQDLRAKEQKLLKGNAPDQELAEMRVREQIVATERELKQIHAYHAGHGELAPEFRAQAEKLGNASRRIHHLRVAAQNLKMAEEHELAHKLMDQAAAMERDVHEAWQRLSTETHASPKRQGEHAPDAMRELKEEIQRLRDEVRELSQKIDKR